VSLKRINAEEALQALDQFDAILDARSPAEYALDHLPGALNWPTLSDQQRHEVGTAYKQIAAFEARKRGAAMAARNIADHLDRHAGDLPRHWRPLVYCWRGGQRSGSLALVLSQVGFEVTVLEGGYRAFRSSLVQDLERLAEPLQFRVLCGRTGTGKSRLLQALADAGEPVVDLEALACHRGSVLGETAEPQPSQKQFETRLWAVLRRLPAQRPVYVESESRRIGRLTVPDALLLRMRQSECVHLDMPLAARAALLLQDYPQWLADPEALCRRLQTLTALRGHDTIQAWQDLARSGRWETLVERLLDEHYDPVYTRSMARNYQQFGQARPLELADASPQAMSLAVHELLHDSPADRGNALRRSVEGSSNPRC
jgi:tRNA 2-selenouridine synthase